MGKNILKLEKDIKNKHDNKGKTIYMRLFQNNAHKMDVDPNFQSPTVPVKLVVAFSKVIPYISNPTK